MATTIRTYRHNPTVAGDPTGTLVDTEVDADDLPGSASVSTTGWTAGSYQITVTAQKDGETESAKSNAISITVNNPAASLDIVSVSSWVHKGWDTTRDVTLPALVLTGTQRGYLVIAMEDGGSGYDGTWSFASLGFTPTKLGTDGTTAGGAKTAIYYGNPGAGTYNGTATMTGTGTMGCSLAWVVVDGITANTGKTSVNHLDTASIPSTTFAVTGSSNLLFGIVSAVDGSALTAASGCTTVSEYTTDNPRAAVVRTTGLVNAATYTLGGQSPTTAVADWSIQAVEVD